jgi:hypothetical protein
LQLVELLTSILILCHAFKSVAFFLNDPIHHSRNSIQHQKSRSQLLQIIRFITGQQRIFELAANKYEQQQDGNPG